MVSMVQRLGLYHVLSNTGWQVSCPQESKAWYTQARAYGEAEISRISSEECLCQDLIRTVTYGKGTVTAA
jgi:hypothetical protein